MKDGVKKTLHIDQVKQWAANEGLLGGEFSDDTRTKPRIRTHDHLNTNQLLNQQTTSLRG